MMISCIAKRLSTKNTADDMIARTKGARLLAGWRGAPEMDRDALAECLVRLSQHAGDLPSFEINPLIVCQKGIVGVDLVVDS